MVLHKFVCMKPPGKEKIGYKKRDRDLEQYSKGQFFTNVIKKSLWSIAITTFYSIIKNLSIKNSQVDIVLLRHTTVHRVPEQVSRAQQSARHRYQAPQNPRLPSEEDLYAYRSASFRL